MENALIFYQILSTNHKANNYYMKISLENLCVDTGA